MKKFYFRKEKLSRFFGIICKVSLDRIGTDKIFTAGERTIGKRNFAAIFC